MYIFARREIDFKRISKIFKKISYALLLYFIKHRENSDLKTLLCTSWDLEPEIWEKQLGISKTMQV